MKKLFYTVHWRFGDEVGSLTFTNAKKAKLFENKKALEGKAVSENVQVWTDQEWRTVK